MWGEEEDLEEGLSGLPVERMIGEEAFLGIGDLITFLGSARDKGESNDDDDEGNGTESWAVGKERKGDGGLFCVEPSLASSCWSCSSLKWNMAFFWEGLRLGKEPRGRNVPGPCSSEKEGSDERVRL